MHSSFRFFVPLCFAALSQAQTSPAPAPSTSAPPSVPRSGILVLDQFVTSVTPFARNQVDLAQSTTVLSGTALLLKQQPTIGDTLAAETGIQASAFGPGASRPIIRGLGGDRIRLLENSVGTLDASVVSPDHAVSVEPFLIDRIEIVRGPASLLYGSNAVGGVVNVITHRIETELPAGPARGAAEFQAGTAANERAGGGMIDVSWKTARDRGIVLHLDGFRRRTENLRIPGFAKSAPLRAFELEHAEEPPEFARGRLPNSSLDTRSGAVGLSYVTPSFNVGVSQSGFDSNYGVPVLEEESGPVVAEGVRIDLRQRRTDLQAEWKGDTGFLRGARLKFGRARYRHGEIEPDGALGTVFTNKGYEGRFELLHGDAKPWAGAVGAQVTRSDFGAVGEEAFLPPSRTDTAAVFAFEELSVGAVAWQFGGRYEWTKVAPVDNAARREGLLTGSLGAVWKLNDSDALALSLAHTGRAPNTQELFANGPHAGTQTFELGDATLERERSWGLEASFRRRKGFVTGALTLFAHRFENYIFEEPSGLVAFEGEEEWTLISSDSPLLDAAEGQLPVYRYVQRRAQFWGAEIETIWHLHNATRWNLDLRLAADFTRARENSRNLPRIPAARTTAGLAWAADKWSAGTECQWVFKQSRVAANESPSGGYALLSAYVSREIELGRIKWELFLRGSNLLNEEARPHVSFVKELAPLAGRAATAGIRLRF